MNETADANTCKLIKQAKIDKGDLFP